MRILKLCGIKYPILAGPMAGISLYPLVTAVSKAGGLGCLATHGIKSRDQFKEEVNKIRTDTDAPFAVNIAWVIPGSEEIMKLCLEEKISLVISSAGMPEKGLKILKGAGIKILQIIANVSQARKAEDLGVDAVIAKSWESAGLNAVNAIASFPLIPQVVDALAIPVVAAGGIADGRGLAAAFSLGAEGVLMGTRFLVTNECPIHDIYKNSLVSATDVGTRMHIYSKYCIRFMRSKYEESLNMREVDWDDMRRFDQECEIDDVLMSSGQITGLITKVVSVNAVIEDIMKQYKSTVSRLQTHSFD
jgi:enoyl-[acyl-carrier protein] reductase II